MFWCSNRVNETLFFVSEFSLTPSETDMWQDLLHSEDLFYKTQGCLQTDHKLLSSSLTSKLFVRKDWQDISKSTFFKKRIWSLLGIRRQKVGNREGKELFLPLSDLSQIRDFFQPRSTMVQEWKSGTWETSLVKQLIRSLWSLTRIKFGGHNGWQLYFYWLWDNFSVFSCWLWA